jgi:hypothetical protein
MQADPVFRIAEFGAVMPAAPWAKGGMTLVVHLRGSSI